MFDNKELTMIMSLVVKESVSLKKEINVSDSKLEEESLQRELTRVNAIGAKISPIINSDLQQEDRGRINIVCSEKDKNSLLEVFKNNCPFDPYPENCGEDERCSECIEKHINFYITE